MTRRPADNPFRASAIESLAFRDGDGDAVAAMRRIESAGRVGSIVGPHGSGKTTLLLGLADLYAHRGCDTVVCRLGTRTPRITEAHWRRIEAAGRNARVVLLDSAGWLKGRDLRRLLRIAPELGGLIVTSHRPAFKPVLIRTEPSPVLVRELLAELVGDEAGAWWPTARSSLTANRGNVREVWRELYDRWLTRPSDAAPV